MKNIEINRPVYNDQTLRNSLVKPVDNLSLRWPHRAKRKCASCVKKWSLKDNLKRWFPIATWLLQFDFRHHLVGEIIAGMTIAFINIPQGMAFAALITLPSYYGLYVSCFPVIIYALMGSCHHQSWGGFGVTAIMTGDVVLRLVGNATSDQDETSSDPMATSTPDTVGPNVVDVAVTIALTVGIIQCIMGFLHLGLVSVYLSKSFIQALTTGASFHVATSQISQLLGVTVSRHPGSFGLFQTWIDIFSSLDTLNWATVVVSLVAFVLLLLLTLVHKLLKKKLPVRIPVDMIVVVLLTLLSYIFNLNAEYDVAIVGKVRTGLPPLRLPSPSLMPTLLIDSFAIALVTYAVNISLGKTIAERHNYKIDDTQELLASGFANSISSFLLCYVSGPSLSRIWIAEKAGARSQLTSIINSVIVLIMILALGRFLQPLPKAVLAVVLIFSLKEMFTQFRSLPSLYRKSFWDFCVWIATFSMVIMLGVAVGLFASLIISLFTLVLRIQFPGYTVEGRMQGGELFLNKESYKVDVPPRCTIFHMESSLCFLNATKFKEKLMDYLQAHQKQDSELVTSGAGATEAGGIGTDQNLELASTDNHAVSISVNGEGHLPTAVRVDGMASIQNNLDGQVVLINCHNFSFVDLDGAAVLASVISECKKEGAKVLLAGCSDNVRKTLFASGHFDDLTDAFYPSLIDAYTSQF